LRFAEEVNEVDALHQEEELLEVQARELQVGLQLPEDGLQDRELQLLGWPVTISARLFKLSPV